jgi:hypothetical protein
MTHEDFEKLVHEENEKSAKLLIVKGREYSRGEDRLQNFKCASGAMNTNPAEALAGMLVKHFVSLLDMARSKDPLQFCEYKWDEKLLDIRNYTYLLKGVLIDMGLRNKIKDQVRELMPEPDHGPMMPGRFSDAVGERHGR